MKHFVHIIPWLILLLCSCGNSNESARVESLSSQFPTEINAVDSVYELPVEVAIKQWSMSGDTLIILTTDHKNMIMTIDLKDMSLIDSIGTIGQGPGEFLTPVLLNSDKDEMFLADAMKGTYHRLQSSGYGPVVYNLGTSVAMNDAYIVSPHNLLNVEYTPKYTRMIIRDLVSGNVTDSLNLPIVALNRDNISTPDFKVGSAGKYSVVAYQGVNRFDIITNDGEKLNSRTVFEGNSPTGNLQFFYIGVENAPEYFALLSMKGKDVTDRSTTPDIELYDYNGNPIAKIHINFVTGKMLMDSANNRMLLLGQDDKLHIISLPESGS